MNKKNISLLIILSITAITFYISIINNDSKKELNTDIKTDKYWYADSELELEGEKEKVTLLSIIKNTEKDSIKLILRDYIMNTENDSIPFEKIITSISKKYNFSKQRIASIVFSYKYEMLTKEDITSDYLESENNYQESKSDLQGLSDRY